MATKDKEVKKIKRPMAEKRVIQNEKRRLINKAFKTTVRTAMRSFQDAVKSKDSEKVTVLLNEVYSLADKGVKRGIFKIGKASRMKSRSTAQARAAA